MSKQNGAAKDVTSISVNKEILDRAQSSEHINLSGLCNDLLDEYFASGSTTKARLEAKRDRLLEQREHLEAELAHVEDELDAVEDQLEEHRDRAEKLEQTLEDLADRLPEDLDATNPAVQNWARKLELTPTELTEEIRALRSGVHVD